MVPAAGESLRRLRLSAQRPPPVVGLERPPRPLLVALRAAADEAAAGAATLALLEAAPRRCDALLSELAERERRVNRAAREVRRAWRNGSDAPGFALLASALTDVAQRVRDAGWWWCRSAGCAADLHGLGGVLRDATRQLAQALTAFPERDAGDALGDVHRRVSEGRRVACRGRRGRRPSRGARPHERDHGGRTRTGVVGPRREGGAAAL
jgi:hypothetical protein